MRSLLFIFLLLGSFWHAVAQTDTSVTGKKNTDTLQKKVEAASGENARSLSAGDTGSPVRSLKQAVHSKKADSASAVKKNSPPGVVLPAGVIPGGAKDSNRTPAPIHTADTVQQVADGINAREQVIRFQSVLKIHPWFNFMGKAQVEEMVKHNPDSKDILFYLLLAILFYFALVRIFFEKYFDNLLTLFFRISIRQQQIREQVLQTPLPSLLLNILFIISGGLYACWLVRYYQFAGNINFWILLINCMAALGIIYLGKFLLLKFCGWVFNISRATDIYIFVVFLVNKMMGIFLLPFLIILFFSGSTVRAVFVTISLSMILVFFVYRVIASFRPIRNEIKLTPFHFFLYLCAFEIAPLLLIYKVLLTYLEKAY